MTEGEDQIYSTLLLQLSDLVSPNSSDFTSMRYENYLILFQIDKTSNEWKLTLRSTKHDVEWHVHVHDV